MALRSAVGINIYLEVQSARYHTLMVDKDDNNQEFRRRAFLLALPITATAVTLIYFAELGKSVADPFNAVALPLLALLLTALTAAQLLHLIGPNLALLSPGAIA